MSIQIFNGILKVKNYFKKSYITIKSDHKIQLSDLLIIYKSLGKCFHTQIKC